MFQVTDIYKILRIYEEYKKQFSLDIIGIVPKAINESEKELAYTDNEELVNCINRSIPVTLYYNKRLFKCSEKYIKAILYHEFTHIRDCYYFISNDNANILMSSYSEYNAMKLEFFMRCNEEFVELDHDICGEKKKTTPRKEIENYLKFIIDVSNNKQILGIQNEMGLVVNMFVKSVSWLLAILSYYEVSEPEYFERCFTRMDNSYRFIVRRLYETVQDIEKIKNNPNELVHIIYNLIMVCV